eukprot:CAMPEP_0172485266 /NCGR_PEP_ID=MMETSP1066-20121228/13227_1 /TAXON_ID=671091 /ORGANISM="Coscinodiscus wailesii, Strain CCMP2513" /LENGTH=224 /DNA_ID=CAMNT_0013250409 /DNA_START=75 /DNA_END=749 /DNA_ORIENTATION=+
MASNLQKLCQTVPPPSSLLPKMIVFDLDDCLWTPEVFTLPSPPSIPVRGDLNPSTSSSAPHRQNPKSSPAEEGIIGMRCAGGGPTVHLFPGARATLRELVLNSHYADVTVALASSSLEPDYSHMCLDIEIVPGMSLMDVVSYAQIGRTGRLSPRKTSHFGLLREESGFSFEEMLFFDDCNWGDHVADLENALGVVGQRTPRGLQLSEFYEGLEKYRIRAQERPL